MEARAFERILNFLYFAIGSERQKLVELLSVEILSYDVDVQHSRKVLKFKDPFREYYGFAIIKQVELTLIDDGFFQTFNGVEIVG